MTGTRSRAIGAIAGIVPAVLIITWYLGAGGPAHGALVGFLMVGVVAGWIMGPRAKGSVAEHVAATIGYFLVAYALQAAVDSAVIVSEGVQVAREELPGLILQRIGEIGLVRVVYLPVWAFFLSRAIASWPVATYVLRRVSQGVRAA